MLKYCRIKENIMYCVTILNIKLIPNFRHVTFKSNKGLGLKVGPGVGLGLGQVNNAGDYKSYQVANAFNYYYYRETNFQSLTSICNSLD